MFQYAKWSLDCYICIGIIINLKMCAYYICSKSERYSKIDCTLFYI